MELMSLGDTIYDMIDMRDCPAVQKLLSSGLTSDASNDLNFYVRMVVSKSYRRQTGLGEFKVIT